MSTQKDHSDDTALAGEYVLRLLGGTEHAAFEARLTQEPALRDLVRDWERQLVSFAEDIEPFIPPASIKQQLDARLFRAVAPVRRTWLRWSMGGMLVTGLVVGALFVSTIVGPQVGLVPTFTAIVTAEDCSLIVAANFVAKTNTLVVKRQTGDALPGRAQELWLIADGAAAPVSLGVLLRDRVTQIILPDALAGLMAGAVLAISDEPVGGSPTGTPTGAVLAAGPVTDA